MMKKAPLTKQGYVYDGLRQDIQAGRIKPGTKLTLDELKKQFGVSHIPIREALRQLEKENLIRLNPHASAEVIGISVKDAILINEIRCRLEPYAAAEALKNMTSEEFSTLNDLVDQLDDIIDPPDLERYIVLNRQFHAHILSLTPNKFLARMVTDLVETANRYRVIAGVNPDYLKLWQNEHHMLLRAYKEGDALGVEKIMQHHLSHVKEVLQAEEQALQ